MRLLNLAMASRLAFLSFDRNSHEAEFHRVATPTSCHKNELRIENSRWIVFFIYSHVGVLATNEKTVSKIAELFFRCYFYVIILNSSNRSIHWMVLRVKCILIEWNTVESRKHNPKWLFVANTCEQIVRTSSTVRVQRASQIHNSMFGNNVSSGEGWWRSTIAAIRMKFIVHSHCIEIDGTCVAVVGMWTWTRTPWNDDGRPLVMQFTKSIT